MGCAGGGHPDQAEAAGVNGPDLVLTGVALLRRRRTLRPTPIAVRGDRILAIGAERDVRAQAGDRARGPAPGRAGWSCPASRTRTSTRRRPAATG